MEVNKQESGRFAILADQELSKLSDGVDKALGEAAGRGFAAPPGVTLEAILAAGQDTKGKLTEGLGKIYDDRRGVLFQETEFEMKIIVALAKLGMELYREELLNALAVEQQEAEQLRDQGKADVERMNAETDKRQVAIIRDRAEMEGRITVYKAQLVSAEIATLPYEEALINAQLATAEKKLEIIDSIYKVLAAEELVLAAEQRRAVSLELVLEAHLELAGIKREMIPFYLQKADARLVLADAITREIPITKALVELGYDRINLKDAEEAAKHLESGGQLELELAKEAWIRANKTTEIAKAQSRRLLQEYANVIKAEILGKKKSLEMDGVSFKLNTSLARTGMEITDNVQLAVAERMNITDEAMSMAAGLTSRAQSHAEATRSSAKQSSKSTTDTLLSRRIVEGIIVG